MVPELPNMMGGGSYQHNVAVLEVIDLEPEATPDASNTPIGWSRAEKMKSMRQRMKKCADLRKEKMFQPVLGEIEVDRVKIKRIAQTRRGQRYLKAENLDNNLVQDKTVNQVVVGSDVEALYPSLLDTKVAEIIFKAIMETKIEIEGVNYQEGARFIVLNFTEQECRLGPLGRVLSVRR